MARRKMTVNRDEPPLTNIGDCMSEIARCNSEMERVQRDYDFWMAQNPGGEARGMLAPLSDWEIRKQRAGSRLEQFISASSRSTQ